MELAKILEMTILSEKKWGLPHPDLPFHQERHQPLERPPLLITWLSSFLALAMTEILEWCRYCLLAVLYFVGPLCFSCLVFERVKFVPGLWFRNVIQLSLWTLILRVVVRVMIELKLPEMLAQANTARIAQNCGDPFYLFRDVILSPAFAPLSTSRKR